MFQTSSSYVVKPTEGGHREWSARTNLEWSIRQHIMELKRQAAVSKSLSLGDPIRVSFEDLVSGPGLVNIYKALRDIKYPGGCTAVQEVLEKSTVDAPAAISAGASRGEPICKEALALLFEILAVFASDLALQSVPGGVYIAGGIIRKNLRAFLGSRFRETFEHKPPHEKMLKATPVFAIKTDKELGVEGAAIRASSLL